MIASKITTTIPASLKEKLLSLKDELHISMATIYKEALEQYLEAKEVERWEKGTKLAQKNKDYIEICKDLGSVSGEIHEY